MSYKTGNIYFEMPDYKKLGKEGWNYYDMHIHTTASDGFTDVNEIIRKAKKYGYGISIADHNTISSALIACKKYKKCIPAIEVTGRELKDFLFYFYHVEELKKFYKECIKKHVGKSLVFVKTEIPSETFVEYAKDYDCILSIAHPGGLFKNNYRYLFKHQLIEKISTIEVLNGAHGMRKNLRNFKVAKKYRKCLTAGSDAHRLKDVGRVLCVSRARTQYEFLDNVKKRKNFAIGKSADLNRMLFKSKLYSKNVKKFFKHLPLAFRRKL